MCKYGIVFGSNSIWFFASSLGIRSSLFFWSAVTTVAMQMHATRRFHDFQIFTDSVAHFICYFSHIQHQHDANWWKERQKKINRFFNTNFACTCNCKWFDKLWAKNIEIRIQFESIYVSTNWIIEFSCRKICTCHTRNLMWRMFGNDSILSFYIILEFWLILADADLRRRWSRSNAECVLPIE